MFIASYSFAILRYLNGSYEIVCLPDTTVPYFNGKHIVLMIVATLSDPHSWLCLYSSTLLLAVVTFASEEKNF